MLQGTKAGGLSAEDVACSQSHHAFVNEDTEFHSTAAIGSEDALPMARASLLKLFPHWSTREAPLTGMEAQGGSFTERGKTSRITD